MKFLEIVFRNINLVILCNGLKLEEIRGRKISEGVLVVVLVKR